MTTTPNVQLERPRPRQVVLFMTDTTRWDMLSCYRDTGIRTPNLDRLAAEGVRFERAYTCTPVCGPARSALFTGTWPHSNGAWTTGLALGADVHTIGQRLTDHAVRAAYVGKWHLDATDYFGSGACPPGWDPEYWYDGRRHLEELSPTQRRRSRDPQSNGDVEPEFTFAHRCTERALAFLRAHQNDDFLLVVSYDEPHHPSISPPTYAHLYEDHEFPKSQNVWDTLEGKPEHQRVWAGHQARSDRDAIRIRRPALFAAQTFVDAEIGRVINAIDTLCPRAVVLYTSDHGDALDSHCLGGKGPALYDEIARVPLLARWPGATPPGAVCPHPASHIDVAPTILDLLQLPAPPVLDGTSMVPALLDPNVRVNEYVFSEFGRYEVDHDGFGGFQPLRGVFDGRYKLVVNLLTSDELYDLKNDPDEMTNLIGSAAHADVRARLHDRMLGWMYETRDPLRGYHWSHRPWRTDVPPPTWADRGMTRQRDDDGDQPRLLDYETGLPMTAAVRPKQ